MLEGIKVTNLVENPSFEVDGNGILYDAGLGGVLSTADKVVGNQSVLVASTAGGANKSVFILKADGSTNFSVTAGLLYTVSVWLKRGPGGAGNVTLRLGIEWYDSTPTLISREYGLEILENSTFSLVAGVDWARKSYTADAPVGATQARLFIEDTGSVWTTGKDIYMDGWMFNEGGLQDYVDGTMPGCAWDGTAQASTSRRALKRVYETPPNGLQDLPCFILYPAGQRPERRPSGWRVDHYALTVRLAAHDTDWDRAAAIMEAYRELVVSAFDSDVQADGHATLVNGPEVSQGVQFPYGDKMYLGMDFVFDIRIDSDKVGGFLS